jgi:hypothetical protein
MAVSSLLAHRTAYCTLHRLVAIGGQWDSKFYTHWYGTAYFLLFDFSKILTYVSLLMFSFLHTRNCVTDRQLSNIGSWENLSGLDELTEGEQRRVKLRFQALGSSQRFAEEARRLAMARQEVEGQERERVKHQLKEIKRLQKIAEQEQKQRARDEARRLVVAIQEEAKLEKERVKREKERVKHELKESKRLQKIAEQEQKQRARDGAKSQKQKQPNQAAPKVQVALKEKAAVPTKKRGREEAASASAVPVTPPKKAKLAPAVSASKTQKKLPPGAAVSIKKSASKKAAPRTKHSPPKKLSNKVVTTTDNTTRTGRQTKAPPIADAMY